MQQQSTRKQVEQAAQKPRVSVTFPPDHYAAMEKLAREKRVSIAWVVRDAVQQYLDSEPSLFRRENA